MVFEVIYAAIATILILVSYLTLRTIRHLDMSKPFWLPVFAASLFFLIGSLTTISYELGFSMIMHTVEIVQIFQIAAISLLTYGIYRYSKRIKTNLTEDFIPLQPKIEERLETEVAPKDTPQTDTAFTHQQSIQENITPESKKINVAPECKHQFGYLRTLPKKASVPNECLCCDRIIKCKHSLATALESQVTS
jgi:hypothetical protein